MNQSETLADWVLPALLPSGQSLRAVKDQSDGQHDFDVLDRQGRQVGLVEVTSAVHEASIKSWARQKKHGELKCASLLHGWLLMAHNPDPRALQRDGCAALSILEQHGVTDFGIHTLAHPDPAVNDAFRDLSNIDVENGEILPGAKPGKVSLITSRGQNSDDYILSPETVSEVVLSELKKPDNTRKMAVFSQEQRIAYRHFFVEIDHFTQPAAGSSMTTCNPPAEPPD